MTVFHAAFEKALDGSLEDLWPHLLGGERAPGAVAVYRNTAMKGRLDALEANYPTVTQIVGRDWFRAAAREFVVATPGDDPAFAAFGAGFSDWLAGFGPAGDLPYLAPIARLDRAWTEAHLAPDALALDPEDAAGVGPALAGATARLHPSVRLFWFDWTAPSLWMAHRYPQADAGLVWRMSGEGLLVHRPGADVRACRLGRAEWAFLDSCEKGRTFGVAAGMARLADPGLDLSDLFSRLVTAGVFDAATEGSRP